MEEQGKGVQLQGEQEYEIKLNGYSWVMVQEALKRSDVATFVAPIVNAIEKQLADSVKTEQSKG